MIKFEKRKIIPIGIDNFEEMINENHYYIDKTLFIKDVLVQSGKIKLFTRPRRFGKTLNMSMLKYFFDIQDGEENRKLFENLKISETEYMSGQGQYPVIYFSFKDLKKNSWEECLSELKYIISNIYKEFRFIEIKLLEEDKENFKKIMFSKDDARWSTSIKDFIGILVYILR